MPRRIVRALVAALALSTLVISPIVAPLTGAAPEAAAEATGTPQIEFSTTMPPTVLYGREVPVTLTAFNPTTTDAYNLSFREVLPAGTTLASSSLPPDSVTVQQDGTTIVVWSNVADLLAGATVELTYSLDPSPYPESSSSGSGSGSGVRTDMSPFYQAAGRMDG